VNQERIAELMEYYNAALIALSAQGKPSRWARMCYAAEQFHRKYQEISAPRNYLECERASAYGPGGTY